MVGTYRTRTAAGYRVYDDAAAERLRFIAAGKRLGLPLRQLRDLLEVWESSACRDVRDELQPLVREQIARAEQRKADLAIQDWRTLLDSAHREPLPDGGMRIRLPIASASQLAQLVVAEQHCCPFFTFRLTLAGDHVELEARAPDGAESLLADLFGEQVCSC